MPNAIRIGDHLVGLGQRVFCLAEAGVAHNGDIRQALKLVDAAKQAGADCCKFQTFKTSRLVKPEHPFYKTLLPLELSEGQFRAIKAHCDEVGITFLSTPDQEEDADFLDELVPAFKIGSGNLRNLPFLRHVAAKGKPVILSTGMGTLEDVRHALGAIQSAGNEQIVLLHCVSVYPKEDDGATIPDPAGRNLRAIQTLAREFGYPVGLSDHSRMFSCAHAAVALGACVYEAHLKLRDGGLDNAVSLDHYGFKWLVDSIRWLEAALGDGVKRPTEKELETRATIEAWRLR